MLSGIQPGQDATVPNRLEFMHKTGHAAGQDVVTQEPPPSSLPDCLAPANRVKGKSALDPAVFR